MKHAKLLYMKHTGSRITLHARRTDQAFALIILPCASGDVGEHSATRLSKGWHAKLSHTSACFS
jgi:hypothetical protein